MGRGSYTALDWAKLKKTRNLNKSTSVDNVFLKRSTDVAYNSKFIRVRESRDSIDSPHSTPVIIGFDVTASMGYLAKELAVNSLNNTAVMLLGANVVTNPHIMCCAIGDAKCDSAPLQATQFEADIRIIEQLLDLHLEGGGGGNGGESYNLLWYFASRRTSTDHYEKRGKKGFLFTIGDDRCHPYLDTTEVLRVFGDSVPYRISNAELISEVSEKYHLFHIHIQKPDTRDDGIMQSWQTLLHDRVVQIRPSDITLLSDIICVLTEMAEGVSMNAALKKLDQDVAERIAPMLSVINTKPENNNTISF